MDDAEQVPLSANAGPLQASLAANPNRYGDLPAAEEMADGV